MTTTGESRRVWTAQDNKRQMQVSDDAYNARDIAHFNHYDNARMFYPTYEIDMPAHIAEIVAYYAAFPDMETHNHEYKITLGDGEWTAAIAHATATNTGPLMVAAGTFIPPTHKKMDIDFSTVARWVDGLLVEEYLFTDITAMARQLGLIDAAGWSHRPVDMGAAPIASTPVRTEHIAENKRRMKESDDAFNARKLDARSLGYADDLLAHIVGQDPMDLATYLRDQQRILTAFPDLRVHNDPYRAIVGEGDWTCTVGQLTGTQTGPIASPEGMGLQTVPPTNKPIDLLICTFARWRNGEIAQLVTFFDFPSVMRQLGLA